MRVSGFDNEPLFRLFADSVIDHAFHTLDADGRVASWNRGAQRLFGYTAEQAVGLPFAAFYPEESRLRNDADEDLRIAAQRGLHESDGWRVRIDGERIGTYVLLTALRDEAQTLAGYAVVTRNISEYQRSLRELDDQKRRLRSIVETAVDAIIIIDELGTIQTFNSAAERMFGYTADEIVGQNVNVLMPQPYSAEHTGYIQRYLRTGEARIIGIGREIQARRKDGSLFPADLAVSEFHDGKPLFTGVVRDITDRKQMEAEVLQIAEAEQRRIGQELHDDAQQQIAGLTMIARHAADSLLPHVAENPKLGDIATKFARVVEGLRDVNRSLRELARGLVPLHVDAHGLADALAALADQVQDQHAIACTFAADPGVEVNNGELATHLYRIAQEAINNVLKHAGATEITLRLSRFEHTELLEIADNGSGLDERQPTTGRGLQIMAYRAGLIGAILTIRRREPRGTVVRCSLPRGEAPRNLSHGLEDA
jgi:two-component system sensor kinase FixL